MDTLAAKIDRIDEKLDGFGVALEELRGKMVPRQEIEAADRSRVANEVFTTTVAAVEARLTRLEGSPTRALGWISLAASAGLGCLSLLVTIAATAAIWVVWIATHSTPAHP